MFVARTCLRLKTIVKKRFPVTSVHFGYFHSNGEKPIDQPFLITLTPPTPTPPPKKATKTRSKWITRLLPTYRTVSDIYLLNL
jgi:hypothetical protein